MLGAWQLDDLQTDAVFRSLLSSFIARIALVNRSDFHRLSRCLLNLLCQLSDVRAVVLVCCSQQRQQMPQRIDGAEPAGPGAGTLRIPR